MRVFFVAISLLASLNFCSRDKPDRPGETVTTTGGTLELVPPQLAHDRGIAAQCMREQLCVEVGLAREDGKSCADRAKGTRCDHAIDGRVLETCLDAIYNASCSMKLEARGAVDACNANVLCRAP